MKQQTDYYEERVATIDDIKYGVFSGKQAEEDNKALQYENKKLIDEKDKLLKENHELREAAGYWNLLYQGIMTYTDDKKKKAMEMINKFINRGKDPLQTHIDDRKMHNDISTKSSNIKHNLSKEHSDREERF